MVLSANTSGSASASSTVSGSSGQPGLSGAKPASANTAAHRSQLLGNSHNPWMNNTGWSPDSLACWICSSSGRCAAVVMSVMYQLRSFGPQRGTEELAALGGRGLRSLRVFEGVQHHEVMHRAQIADGGHRDAGGTQLRCVRLAFVAEHVGLVDDDQRRWQPGQIVEGCAQRRGEDLAALFGGG